MAGDPVKREQEHEATQAVPSGATNRPADSDMSVYEILNWFYDPRQRTQDGNSSAELYGHARDVMGLTYELAVVEYAVGMKIRSDEDRKPSLYEMRAIAKFVLGGKSDYGKTRVPREEPAEHEEPEDDSEVIDEEGEEPETRAPPKEKGEEKIYTQKQADAAAQRKYEKLKDGLRKDYAADMEAKDKEMAGYKSEIGKLKEEAAESKKTKPKPKEADAIKVKADEIRKELEGNIRAEMEKKYRTQLDKDAAKILADEEALKKASKEIGAYKKRGKETEDKLRAAELERDAYKRKSEEKKKEAAKEPAKEPVKESEEEPEKADEEKFADATVKYGKLAHQIETKYNGRDDEEAVLARGYLEILDDLRAKGNYEAVEKGVDGFDAYLNDAMEKRAKEAEKTKTTKAPKEPESMLADIQREEREPVKLKDYTDTELFKASGMTLDEFNAYLQAQGLSGYKDVTHVNEDGTFYRPQDQGTREYTEDLLSGKIKMPEPVSEEEPPEKEETEKIAISEEPIEVKHDYTGSGGPYVAPASDAEKDEWADVESEDEFEELNEEFADVTPTEETTYVPQPGAPAEPAKSEQTYEDILVNALKGDEPKGPEEEEGKRGSDTEVPSKIGTPATPTSGLAPSPKIPPKAQVTKDRLIGDSVLPRKKVERQNKNIEAGAEPESKKASTLKVTGGEGELSDEDALKLLKARKTDQPAEKKDEEDDDEGSFARGFKKKMKKRK